MDLRAQLEGLKVGTYSGQAFIPDVELDKVITEPAIRTVINDRCGSTISSHEVPQLVAKILHGAKKIFAILVLIEREYLIKDFIYRRCNDDSLFHPIPKEIGDERFRERFERDKWGFLAPVFEVGELHREMHTKTILPFIERKAIGSGASATVFKVKLHPLHQKLVPGAVFVAVKEIAKTTTHAGAAFDSERKTLEKIRCTRHRNIVGLLATYTFQDKHNMIFPLAQMDLKTFLESKPFSPFDKNRYIFKSMRDLASALETIHNPPTSADNALEISELGYHHDIKPRNILIVDNVLMITDFGLSRFKPNKGTMTETNYRGGDMIYGAPERQIKDLDTGQVKVGRKLDIWSLGCVFLELVCFAVVGPSGLGAFREDRNTKHGPSQDMMFYYELDVKQEVLKWIARLKMDTEDPLVAPILDIIRKMLQGSPEVRPTAVEVRKELEAVLQDNCLQKQSISPDTVSDTIQELREKNKSLMELVNRATQSITTTTGDTTGNFVDRRVVFFALQIEFYRLSAILDDDNDQAVHLNSVEARRALKDRVEGGLRSLGKIREYLNSALSISNLGCMKKPEELAMKSLEESVDVFRWHIDRLERLILPGKPDYCQKRLALQVLPSFNDHYRLELVELACSGHYRILERSAQLKRRRIEINQGSSADVPGLKLELDQFDIPDFSDRSLCRCNGLYRDSGEEGDDATIPYDSDSVPVLIEWKQCDPNWCMDECDQILDRVKKLAQLLNIKNKPLRALQCMGYIEDCDESGDYVDRYGFVFRLPEDTNPVKRPLSLSSLIASTKFRPSLSYRFQLASKLAEHLSTLHSVDWLHKGLRSENVLFFEGIYAKEMVTDIPIPYLSGFEFSRPDRPNEWSIDAHNRANQDLYLHPDLQPTAGHEDQPRPRFHRLYDIYSLGLILFEIGFWEGVECHLKGENMTPEDLKRRIISKTKDIMGHLMGLRYRDVVLRCLSWDFEAAGDDRMRDGKELLNEFSFMVVKELNKCHCRQSRSH